MTLTPCSLPKSPAIPNLLAITLQYDYTTRDERPLANDSSNSQAREQLAHLLLSHTVISCRDRVLTLALLVPLRWKDNDVYLRMKAAIMMSIMLFRLLESEHTDRRAR